MSTIKEEEVMNRMARYCVKSEQSRADVWLKMKRWGISRELMETVIQALEAGGFINDERFTRSFIHDKFHIEQWGRIKIAQALDLRNIPEKFYRPLLREINEEEYIDTLKKIIESKQRSLTKETKQRRLEKLIRYAAGRGFEMRYIKRCLGIEGEEDV